jgi:hypothetical protein
MKFQEGLQFSSSLFYNKKEEAAEGKEADPDLFSGHAGCFTPV